MKCKYCGKECSGEVCDACAKIENAANGAISSAKYAKEKLSRSLTATFNRTTMKTGTDECFIPSTGTPALPFRSFRE